MEEKIKTKTEEKEFNFKLIAGSLFAISWLTLIGIRMSSDYPLKVPLIFSIVLTFFFVLSLFGRKIYQLGEKLKLKEKTAKQLTEDEIDEIEEKTIKKMWNYIEKGTPTERKLHNINDNMIYEHHLKLYREIELSEEKTDEIIILINSTFSSKTPSNLPADIQEDELKDAINKMSKNWENPDIEEEESTIDQFGKPTQRIKRTSHQRPKEQKEESVV